MARIEKTIFISYRRKDISWALAVYQYLTSQKYDVFFDYTSIPSGDFEQIIVSNIRGRAHFVLVLTPTALDRCSQPGDWLRREIETAVDEKRNIIPLLFDGFNFASPSVTEKLTGKLAAIPRYNALDIPSGYFMEAMERLRHRYLNVPLNAVIHPVPTEVRKVVQEEQVAAEKALEEKKEDIEELVKPAEEKPVEPKQAQIRKATVSPFPFGKGSRDEEKIPNLRLYGIGTGILLVAMLGIVAINALIQNGREKLAPTLTSQIVTNTISVTASVTASVATPTLESKTPVSTVTTPNEEPTPGIGSTMTSPKDGMTLVYIPAGEFHMGFQSAESEERPVHVVDLDAFWMDETEVTNAMYALCVNDCECNRPSSFASRTHSSYYSDPEFDEYPVIFVSWADADSYCEWAGRRLPTEAEWEKAARGRNQRRYPWGEQIDCSNANYKNCIGDTSAVKSYESGMSPYGIHNMAGNVWEWVADWYSETYYQDSPSPSLNPLGPDSGEFKVLRGGSWDSPSNHIRSTIRNWIPQRSSDDIVGFRCASSE